MLLFREIRKISFKAFFDSRSPTYACRWYTGKLSNYHLNIFKNILRNAKQPHIVKKKINFKFESLIRVTQDYN